MSKTKGGGSTRNGRDSNAQRLASRPSAAPTVRAGAILVRQRGTKFHPGHQRGPGRRRHPVRPGGRHRPVHQPQGPQAGRRGRRRLIRPPARPRCRPRRSQTVRSGPCPPPTSPRRAPIRARVHRPSRTLAFDGCVNFRDLGGYRTADGRQIGWRRLFRADGLHRAERRADHRRLIDLGRGHGHRSADGRRGRAAGPVPGRAGAGALRRPAAHRRAPVHRGAAVVAGGLLRGLPLRSRWWPRARPP